MKPVAEIIRDISELPPEAQRQVSAHLLQLRLKRDEEWQREVAAKIDDRNPANWVSLEEARARILGDGAAS